MRRAAWLWLLCVLCVAGCLRLQDEPDAWPCAQNSDCVSPNVCRGNVCVDPDACHSDVNCSAGKACVASRCLAVQCVERSSAACSPYLCSDHVCATACGSSSECQAGFACRGSACVPAECGTAPATKVCSPYACRDLRCLTQCTSNADCADTFACVQGACAIPLKGLTEQCNLDAECSSGVCCAEPGATLSTCAAVRCAISGVGGACSNDQQCSTQNCVSGLCKACDRPECIAALCGAVKCGIYNGVNCGTCTGELVCNDGSCAAPCNGRVCGEDHGVRCGSCADKQYCDPQGKCQSACGDHDCGFINGTACGTCPAKSHCDASVHCAPACDGIECGSNLGADCGACTDTNKACIKNKCETAVCPPQSTAYCKNNDVYLCDQGTTSTLATVCGPNRFCSDTNGNVQCKDKCTPGQAYCDEQVYGVCAADGLGQTPGGQSCTKNQMQCSALGCETTDGVGACADHPAAWAVGNVYSVSSSVTLDRFAQFFAAEKPRFFVYESSTKAGPFTEIASKPASSSNMVEIQYSPSFDIPLVAGRFYILGVASDKLSTFCSYDGVGNAVSFGALLNNSYSSGAAALPASVSNPTGFGESLQYVLTVPGSN